GVVDGTLPRGWSLRRGRALEGIRAQYTYFEAVLAALESLDSAECRCGEQRGRVHFTGVDACRRLHRKRIEMIRGERLLLGAAACSERLLDRGGCVALIARDRRADDSGV